MTAPDTLVIRLSRTVIALFLLAGSFFFLAGLDIGFFHWVLPVFDITPDKVWVFWLFLFFFVGCGGRIIVQMLLYLVQPPTLLRANESGIAFATGMRYVPFTIAWAYVESIGLGIDPTMLAANKQLQAGLQIRFRKSDDIPGAKATSMGVSYFMYALVLNWFYMDTPAGAAIERLTAMRERYVTT